MDWRRLVAGLSLCLLVVGCGAGLGARTNELIERDYLTMTDTELLGYYQRLSDQLARESRASRTKGSTPFGGPSLEAGPRESDGRIELLRSRWNEVRSLLYERELLP
ncbi:hypothetical protein [Geoalkalibacter subterraneus]|uniref:Lipoprotein n=1 Tax=Geoalkalibacter subterraneus TaxID=483547 RepID=A0A0B5FQP1_9BACT|nr:hypothetical protein [Geoalkalibacter subterraneus]AJF05911.1 hypothetical protein GSUB_04120 [Geoalkalibacter subterraneus]